ncbi:MAG: transglycosylase domain-containing protein [Actinomycetota bacterium]|nr:transglycosylase domain-containing protein [Actinomycetota bacterium]
MKANRSGVTIVIAVLAVMALSCSQLEKLPSLKGRDLNLEADQAQTSKIFDGRGRLVTTLHGTENRTSIPLKRIPRHVRRAVIAIEDERFFQHDGVDLKAVVRALVANIKQGEIAEGGSTITQQYVKKTIIAPGATAEQSMERKIKEAILARQLENRLSKQEILKRYLNTVYFGEGAYGIQAAAQAYFSKGAAKLNLREGASLAGLIKSPEAYNPLNNPRVAKNRRNLVLSKMRELGWMSKKRARRAKRGGLLLDPARERIRYPAPYFVDYVKRLLTYDPRFDVLGSTPGQRTEELFEGGLKIHTTIDLRMQKAAEAAVRQVLYQSTDPYASLVAIDPRTGYVRTMVGGRDFFAPKGNDPYAKVNLATVIEPGLGARKSGGDGPGAGRQAGSSFKVFALAAAIKQGITLSKTYDAGGSCITLPLPGSTEPYRPCNYEGSAYGKISLLEATVNSVNTVFARLGAEIGPHSVVRTAKKMGIRTPLQPVLSAPLGSNGVNALDMASAYGTLAANGRRHSPVAITKIVDSRGRTIYRATPRPKRVLDPVTSYLTTSALEQVITRGTGAGAGIGRPAAGKTGTAQEYRDAWFAGYTPNLTAAVWVGYPEGQIEMKTSCYDTAACRPTRIQVTGGSWPAEIWQAFMLRALANTPALDFKAPKGGITTVVIDTRNGCLAGAFTPADARAEAVFAANTAPTRSCIEPGDRNKVPGVLGLSVDAATQALSKEGFGVSVDKRQTSEAPPGVVIGQDPSSGTAVAAGTTVTLLVSEPAPKPEPEPSPEPSPSDSPGDDGPGGEGPGGEGPGGEGPGGEGLGENGPGENGPGGGNGAPESTPGAGPG